MRISPVPAAEIDQTRLTFGIVANAAYAGLSLLLGTFAVKLFRDHMKTFRAVRSQPNPSQADLELTCHDMEQETVRVVKQAAAFVMLWLPLLLRPVLEDWPDRPLFEIMRAGVFLFMLSLCFNSYRELSFREKFRRKWGTRPRPLA